MKTLKELTEELDAAYLAKLAAQHPATFNASEYDLACCRYQIAHDAYIRAVGNANGGSIQILNGRGE